MSGSTDAANGGSSSITSAYDNTKATIHVTSAGGYTDDLAVVVTGTASGLGFPAIDTYDNAAQSGGGGVYGGKWQSTIALVPGDNVISAGPEIGSAAPSDNSIDEIYVATDPIVAIDQAGGNTNSSVQTLSGSVSTSGFGARFVAGTALTLSDDGAVLGRTTVGADGRWSASVTLAYVGRNDVEVADTDLAGNTDYGLTTFYLKTSTPTVAITSAGGTVSDALQVISGTASAGAGAGPGSNVVTVSEDGAEIGSATVGTDGTWALVTTLGGVGSHVFQATEADRYGNVGVSNTVAESLATPPTTPAVVMNGSSLLDTTPPAVAVGAAAPTTPATAITGSSLLDTTPPAVAFGAPPQLKGSIATLSGTASDASGIASVEIYDGSTALGAAQVNGDGSWTFTHDFGQGSYDGLTAVAIDAAGNSARASALYELVTGSPGAHSVGETTVENASGAITSVTTTAADGSIGAQTVSKGDGTATGTGYENGQALFSIGNDVMTGNGYRENFVFGPTVGHARITDFVVAGGGHDTITLSHQDFDTVAQVLRQTTMSNGSALIHVSPDETIRLAGVTKAQLAQHRGDFAFTG